MADISALYPQPVAAPQGALSGDPAKILGIVGALNQNKLFNAQYPALAQQPAAALEGQDIANRSHQMEQDNAATQIAAGHFGSLPDNAKPEDVYRMKAAIRAIYPNISAEKINQVADVALREPRGLQQGIATLRTMGLSPESRVGRVAGEPGPGGAPTTIPVTSAVRSGQITTGLAPGETELLTSPAARAEKLQASASTSPQYHADLENLKADSRILENLGGPTFETEKKLNQLTSRLGGFGITMTPEQLKAGESFDKIANQISLNQSALFHGSDAGLHTVVGANPSTSMSRFGRDGVIDMLHGNQDAIDVMRKTWLKARANGAPASSYDQFAERIGQELDPRVFQFNRLSRDNQQKFLSQMDPEDLKGFEDRFKNAVANKWVKPLKAPPAADGK